MNEEKAIKIINNLIDDIYTSSSGVGKAGLKQMLKYIKTLQQENAQLKQQLKDKDEKISKVIEFIKENEYFDFDYNSYQLNNYKNIKYILESNKED